MRRRAGDRRGDAGRPSRRPGRARRARARYAAMVEPGIARADPSQGRGTAPFGRSIGVADRSLYRRMRDAGFVDLVCFPSMVTLDRPGGPIWRNREDHILSLLTPDELAVWHAERDRAEAEGLLFMAHPLHCAVGTKPRAAAG